ncbi:hypothetical protein M9Y10_010181 [Tritrichomonas musculus]|uniref:Uncharacterized protein n=1 Tax=Tritrichomonas musculus TaxID=1915356 RepID=A0ABR2IRK1_9EUKA
MGFKDFVKSTIKSGLSKYGKHIFIAANFATMGRVVRLYDATTGFLNKTGGLIGKVAGQAGRKFLSQKVRDKLSTAANDVIDVLPNSRLKGALIKINNAAQNKAYDKPAIDYSIGRKKEMKNNKYRKAVGYEG